LSGAASPEVDKRSEGNLVGRESAMGAETTTQRPTISRRQLLKYGAVTGAAATVGPVLPAQASAAHAHRLPRVLPAPKPIPGGIQIPGGPLIHVFPPGPTDITLPFTGLTLFGLDVEPSVITDRKGFTALAFHVGTAIGSDGKQYDLETDMRAMEGTYVAENGTRQRGLFAFI
jgi:TAT (twin-arginine translocation) pathway signal sequence